MPIQLLPPAQAVLECAAPELGIQFFAGLELQGVGLTSAGVNRCAGGLGLQSHVQRDLEKMEHRPLPGVVGLSQHLSAMCCSEAAGTPCGTGEVAVTPLRSDPELSPAGMEPWAGSSQDSGHISPFLEGLCCNV